MHTMYWCTVSCLLSVFMFLLGGMLMHPPRSYTMFLFCRILQNFEFLLFFVRVLCSLLLFASVFAQTLCWIGIYLPLFRGAIIVLIVLIIISLISICITAWQKEKGIKSEVTHWYLLILCLAVFLWI